MAISLSISAEFREHFAARGLDSFAVLMSGDVGELLRSERGGRELRRFSLDGAERGPRFYLKRLGREPRLRLARGWLTGHRPHCGPLRELAALNHLRKAGFAVMEPVAWGEERNFGLPRRGFLVVSEVCGSDAAELYASGEALSRCALLCEVGQLVGRLHAAGFFQVVRLKDLIRDNSTGVLVLIDRETGKPWPVRFTPERAMASLARAARRTLRDGHRFGAASLRHFLNGYREGVAPVWKLTAAEMRHLFFREVRGELGLGE